MSTPTPARALADISAGTITATVWINASPERVFDSLTTEEVAAWWGSADTYRVSRWTGDLVPGGAWRSEGVSQGGGSFSVYGEFLTIARPHTLTLTWNHDWDDSPATTVTYRLEARDGGTLVNVFHEGFGDSVASCEGHAQGWERVLGWLQLHASGAAARPVAAVPAA